MRHWEADCGVRSVHYMQDRHDEHAASRQLLTANEVQRRLGVDRSTVYRMALDGRLTAVKVGRQWRFPAEAIERILSGAAPAATFVTDKPARPESPLRSLSVPDSLAAMLINVSAESLGVMMIVTDMEGRPVSEVANPCPWFAQRLGDPRTIPACVAEWRSMADDLHLGPRFVTGPFGFDCARAFIRSGHSLVGMVLAGGIAPVTGPTEGLHILDDAGRARVLDTLPRVAAALARESASPQQSVREER